LLYDDKVLIFRNGVFGFFVGSSLILAFDSFFFFFSVKWVCLCEEKEATEKRLNVENWYFFWVCLTNHILFQLIAFFLSAYNAFFIS